ncbi:MAG: hypothetical protein CNB21_00040 [Pelagibacterales bacterium MED-G39]|jgi:hypothetical protein|nr:MAG: hypothetical protein CNB21_00040 [Pelagibacterales bacterium MED-G39]
MKILKTFFVIFILVILSGCIQTTSLLGPGITVATTGNVLQAGLQYGANTALKNETGKDVLTHIKDSVDEKNEEKKLHVKLKQLIESRIEITRQKLLSN